MIATIYRNKQKYIDRARQHREADEIVQGYGYWDGHKGCAIGCLAHTKDDPHDLLERDAGLPERVCHVADAIFEGLPHSDAVLWPERFVSAPTEDADLSLVWHQFAAWMLSESGLLTITDDNREAISVVAELHRRAAKGGEVSSDEWSAAGAAAGAAARSAAGAAAGAAAKWAAAAAGAAAWSAAGAAWSAAWWVVRSAAWSAAWQKMADKLIELLAAAPLAHEHDMESSPCA